MTIRIQADTDTEGVGHHWYRAMGFGTLTLGSTGHLNQLYFHDAADVDAVIAELTALRAEMTAEAAAAPNPPHHMTGNMIGASCLAEDGGYFCNAQEGHDGAAHVAYGDGGVECHRWPASAPKPVRLVTLAQAREAAACDEGAPPGITVSERARRGAQKSGFEPVAPVAT